VTFVPILISFLRKLISDHRSAAAGICQRSHEVAEVAGQYVQMKADGVSCEGTAKIGCPT